MGIWIFFDIGSKGTILDYNGNQFFQDDNATPRNADVVNEWLDRHGIQRIAWPSQSPDLNIIGQMTDE